MLLRFVIYLFFFFQAEDGIRDLVRSRGLGDVYKRQLINRKNTHCFFVKETVRVFFVFILGR